MADVKPRSDDELLLVGLDVVVRLRDGEDRAAVRQSLHGMPIRDLRELILCLAACVDPDVQARDLLAWNGGRVPQAAPPPPPRQLRPCGTEAAWVRHRANGEECLMCAAAMRELWAARQAKYRRRRWRGAV